MQQSLKQRRNICLVLHTLFENECTEYKKRNNLDGHVFQEFIVINNVLIKTW